MNNDNYKQIKIPILIISIIMMVLYNFKIESYNKYFMIPVVLLIICYIYMLKRDNLIINRKGFYYLIPIILIIIGTTLFNTDISNKILNIMVLPILISMLFLTLTNENYQLSGDFLKWTLQLFPKRLLSNLEYIKGKKKENRNEKKNKNITNIILGIFLSIPFVVIILSLLTSADMYFKTFIENIFMNFNGIFNTYTIRDNIAIFIIYFIIFFSVYINIIRNKDVVGSQMKKRKIEIVAANTLLIMINLVFVLFITSEISKITVNFLQVPEKYTYAMYAREGFFQLLLVTVINYAVIIFFLYRTDGIKQDKLLKRLILLLIAFTIILIFNSYYRMFLYIYEYGFTVLRMQVIIFLLMELIILGIIIKKIIKGLKHRDAILYAIVIMMTYVINIWICNMDAVGFINRLIGKM